MTTEITGGNNQVGPSNSQFITSNSNNSFNITMHLNMHFNGSTSLQHQQQQELSISGGQAQQQGFSISGRQAQQQGLSISGRQAQQQELSISGEHAHHFLDSLHKLAASCGHTTQIDTQGQSQAAIQSKEEPPARGQGQVARKRKRNQSRPIQQAGTDSVRILDSRGLVLKPGDAVDIDSVGLGLSSLYVGDGYLVHYNEYSKTVVKEKLDMTFPFRKWRIGCDGNLEVYSPTQRVQRALQQVGRECPVQGGDDGDFVFWIHTGLDRNQSYLRGFRI